MYRVEVLPAEYGDALWVEFGPAASPRRILIDCGTPGVYQSALAGRIKALPEKDRRFDLFVITHIDADHIGGAVRLLKDREKLGVEFGDIWFNGFHHLLEDDEGVRGPMQGEQLSHEIRRQKLPWNVAFDGRAVVVRKPGKLPVKSIGGMKLTLLSPYPAQLAELRLEWDRVIRAAGLVPGAAIEEEAPRGLGEDDLPRGEIDVAELAKTPYKEDQSEANGSSIAFLAEYEGKTVLFGADAFASVLLRSLKTLGAGARADVLKVAHHGSAYNTSLELLKTLGCTDYLISTNGKRFGHPDLAGIARLVRKDAVLHFNYRTKFNRMWDGAGLKKKHAYSTNFPPSDSAPGITWLGAK